MAFCVVLWESVPPVLTLLYRHRLSRDHTSALSREKGSADWQIFPIAANLVMAEPLRLTTSAHTNGTITLTIATLCYFWRSLRNIFIYFLPKVFVRSAQLQQNYSSLSKSIFIHIWELIISYFYSPYDCGPNIIII